MRTILILFLVNLCSALAGDPAWTEYFPSGKKAEPVVGLKEGDEAFRIMDHAGHLLGFVFRTDKVSPVIKGKRDQIGVFVALDSEGRILGAVFVSGRETKKHFRKITSEFYAVFKGRDVKETYQGVDTVTGATVSSRAIIRDIYTSGREVLRRAVPKEGE